jgi:putative flippase GtrA
MRKIFVFVGNKIRSAIDFFYPPFKPYMSVQFFRYGVTGGANLLFDWVVYFLIFNYVLQKQMLNLGIITMSSHIATFALKFPVVFFSGFLLQKYVTFTLSELRGHVQLYRYLVVVLINLIINYAGLKLLVEIFNIYPSVSNIIVSTFTVFISYAFQNHYTFKAAKPNDNENSKQILHK